MTVAPLFPDTDRRALLSVSASLVPLMNPRTLCACQPVAFICRPVRLSPVLPTSPGDVEERQRGAPGGVVTTSFNQAPQPGGEALESDHAQNQPPADRPRCR